MRTFRIIVIGFVIILWFSVGCGPSSDTLSDCYYLARLKERTHPTGEVFLMNAHVGASSRIDVYYQIPYCRLKFEHPAWKYQASYDVSIFIRRKQEEIVASKEVHRNIVAASYDETQSNRCDAFLESFILEGGDYVIDLLTTDHISGLQDHDRRDFFVRTFADDSVQTSDMLFAGGAEYRNQQLFLQPIFPSQISLLRDSFYIFQELYELRAGDTLLVDVSYSDRRYDVEPWEKFSPTYPPIRFRNFMQRRPVDSLYANFDSVVIVAKNGSLQLLSKYPKPKNGITILGNKLLITRGNHVDSVLREQVLMVHSQQYPWLTPDEMVDALGTIARDEEFDTLRAAKTTVERRSRIAEFWEHHGGASRRRDFEQRVREANELFTSCTDGWKTAMGIAYIVCGPPDYVECTGAISETWYYGAGNQSLVLPFKRDYQRENDCYELVGANVDSYLWRTFVDRWRMK